MTADDKPLDSVDPARAALDQPHLTAEELEEEIGDSEPWDEASLKPDPEDPELARRKVSQQTWVPHVSLLRHGLT